MPVWLQIIIAIVGALGTICGILGISSYVSERQKHKAQKKNEDEDRAEQQRIQDEEKLEKMRHDEYINELREIIRSEISPIAEDLDKIQEDLQLVKRGVQVTCRNDLEDIADKAQKQKFLSAYDKQRFESAYQSYHSLGKNGVMDAKRDAILNYPETKPSTSTRKKSNKKQLLFENK